MLRTPATARGVILFILAAVSSALPSAVRAADWYVDCANACPGTGTPADPFCHIQAGIAAASNGDRVLVRPGVYHQQQQVNFLGKAITVRSYDAQGNLAPHDTIIRRTDGATKVVFDSEEGTDSVLEGFTITGPNGLGILCSGASPTIRQTVVTQNGKEGLSGGGGIRLFDSSAIVEDSRICGNVRNTAGIAGGGISIGGASSPEFRRCVIVGNKNFGSEDPGSGGGISFFGRNASGVSAQIDHCIIKDNYADNNGGGVHVKRTPASGSGSEGGGTCNAPGCDDPYTVRVENSLLAGNQAGGWGGGLAAMDCSDVTVVNTTFSKNRAEHGGASVTFIACQTIRNSVLWGDNATSDNGEELSLGGEGILDVDYSDVLGGSAPDHGVYQGFWTTGGTVLWGPANIDADPDFRDTGSDDFRLLAGSPAIDAGDNNQITNICSLPPPCPPGPATCVDLEGLPRIMDGDGNGSCIVDMGAHEFQNQVLCTSNDDCDDQDACNGTETCAADGVCETALTDCNGNCVQDLCDITGGFSQDCNVTLTPDECEGGPFDAQLIACKPLHGQSLWRTQNNIVRLTFSCDIAAPGAGDVPIQELLSGGAFGADLSDDFTFTVESPCKPRILKINAEPEATLSHETWYAIRNTGAWSGVGPFEVQHVNVIGDATNDNKTVFADVLAIDARVPTFGAEDDAREDVNGDGNIVHADVLLANDHVPTFPPPKPTGHAGCTACCPQ